MSVATKSYVSSYANNQHTDEMAQRPRSPTSNHILSQPRMNAPNPSHESTLKRPSPSEDDGDHRDKRQRVDAGGDRIDFGANISPTNHNRRNDQDSSRDPNGAIEPQESLQTQSLNHGQIEPGGANVIRGADDASQAFLLCKSSIPRSRPDPNQHLLALYDLGDLLRSVARTDPFTGDKINKLRKSYEGQIKTFGLMGRNRAEKAERAEDEPGPLRKLAMVADSSWETDQGKNKIEVTSGFRDKLNAAMQLQPGKVRNNAEWEDVLGHEKPRPIMSQQPSHQAARIPNGPSPAPFRPATGITGDKRATRGKKRSYGDESFAGYGEGYSDMDEDVEDGDEYTKRRRKRTLSGRVVDDQFD